MTPGQPGTVTTAGPDVVDDKAVSRLALRLIALGMLVLQAAWILAVPPFRGLDEFDHVYKAAAVARGDWVPTPSKATRGTGAWLDVPTDLVVAARAQCESLPYTKAADCVGTDRGSTTRVASGAGRYNPVYYAVVGTPAIPFHGNSAVYVMRLVSLLLCWVLFCAALWATRQWARTPWPTTAIAVASTPVLVYSSTVVAPNGVEMMSGLALWCALLGLLTDRVRRNEGRLLVVAAVSASVLVTTRSLGPLLCLLVVATACYGVRPPRELLTRLLRRRVTQLLAALVFLFTVVNTVWVLEMGALNIGQELAKQLSVASRLRYLLQDIPLWILQSIAAFPARDEPTRPEVYACFLVLFVALTVLGFRARVRSLRSACVIAFVVSLALPLALSARPGTNPTVWQGRYMLPYLVGTAVMIGLALNRADGPRLSPFLRTVGLVLYVVGQTAGPVQVLHKTLGKHLADDASIVHFSPWLVGGVAVIGSAILWWAATGPPRLTTRSSPSPIAATRLASTSGGRAAAPEATSRD